MPGRAGPWSISYTHTVDIRIRARHQLSVTACRSSACAGSLLPKPQGPAGRKRRQADARNNGLRMH
eukprot:4869255-Alexandrium_andersonii.AAC.1